MYTVGGREIEFVAFLNVEEAVPAVNIAYDAIDTLTVQRMGVWFHLVCEGSSRHAVMCKIHEVRTVLRTVLLRIGVEEALLLLHEFVASEALFLQIARICLETNLKATEVGNVLSQTEVAPAHLAPARCNGQPASFQVQRT